MSSGVIMSRSCSTGQGVPLEIFQNCLSFLSFTEIVGCQKCCRAWDRAICGHQYEFDQVRIARCEQYVRSYAYWARLSYLPFGLGGGFQKLEDQEIMPCLLRDHPWLMHKRITQGSLTHLSRDDRQKYRLICEDVIALWKRQGPWAGVWIGHVFKCTEYMLTSPGCPLDRLQLEGLLINLMEYPVSEWMAASFIREMLTCPVFKHVSLAKAVQKKKNERCLQVLLSSEQYQSRVRKQKARDQIFVGAVTGAVTGWVAITALRALGFSV